MPRTPKDMIFVFGSNESGRHGAGAAKFALNFKGARLGLAFGFAGQSFAIPTKDKDIRNTLRISEIKRYVDAFLWQIDGGGPHGTELANSTFQITQLGCGLAGLSAKEVAPLFNLAPDKCWFDTAWKPWLGPDRNYWGTR